MHVLTVRLRYLRCNFNIYGVISRENLVYTVRYGVHIRFGLTRTANAVPPVLLFQF